MRRLIWTVVCLAMVACSTTQIYITSTPDDAGADASLDAQTVDGSEFDTALDTGPLDTGIDTGINASDAGQDSTVDAADASFDGSFDASFDSSFDAFDSNGGD